MVRRLCELGLVSHAPYHGVQLTAAGERVALEVLRHHRLLELYLAQSLGVPWDRVHDEAEVLEHVLSEELEALIADKLGNPTHDPHGDPIPTADLVIEERPTARSPSWPSAPPACFVRVSDADPAMLRYLAERGIAPGADSRSSTASRSTDRSSCASASTCTRSAARSPPRCGSRWGADPAARQPGAARSPRRSRRR